MRLASLAVDDFRAIRQLSIRFGQGVNVLHGPNDLGKSTLAEAVRAALLVPPSSSEADSYQSWYSGNSPRVELALVDDDERWWKVVKRFGSGGSSAAELFHSKDGKIGLDVMTPHGYPLDIDLPVEAVEACITAEEKDLADVVRVFGDRLEQNFRLWKRAAA